MMVLHSMVGEIAYTSAQVFQNPSFEGTPADSQAPPDWFICTGSPDIQPGFWGTTQTPTDGNTYLGFHHDESVSAYFPDGIGLCSGLEFTMDVSIVPLSLPSSSFWVSNNQGVNPGYICIYGGFSSCDFQQLLWQSDLLTNVSNWQTINIQLTATEDFTYLNFTPCVNPIGTWTYFGIDNIQGVVNSPVQVDVGPPLTVCIGEPINLTASYIGAISYNWTGPNGFTSSQQNPTIDIASAADSGTYTVTANVGTCQSDPTTVNVTVNNALMQVNVGPPQTVCIGEPINLTASYIGATSFNWTGPTGFTSSLQNPTINMASDADSGAYTVTVNVGDCQSSPTTLYVTVNNCPPSVSGNNACLLEFPNIFTPNGDGLNDRFDLTPTYCSPEVFMLTVFNRWGSPVFTSDNATREWWGDCGSSDCPAGVYYYVADFEDQQGKTQREAGYVHLSR